MKGLAEYYGQIIDKAIADCTTCGDCLRYCLMSSIRGYRDPQTVMEKLIGFLKREVRLLMRSILRPLPVLTAAIALICVLLV